MSKADDGFTADTLELALSAQMNFHTVERMAPAVGAHPIWKIAQMQLDALVKRLEKRDDQ